MCSASAINTLNTMMAQRLIGQHSRQVGAIMERLITGKRINRASDDPAGLSAATRLELEASALKAEASSNNAQIHKLSVIDGHYAVLADLAIDLEAVVLTAANRDALSEAEREGLQIEADSIIHAMQHIYETSTFKGERIFHGSLLVSSGGSTSVMQFADFETLGRTIVGNRAAETVAPKPPPEGPPESGAGDEPAQTDPATPPEDPDSPWGSLKDLLTGGRLNLFDGDTKGAAAVAKTTREGFVKSMAGVGNQIRSLESRNRTLAAQLEGTQSAYSDIMDTDYAKEMSALVRQQVLQQASVFVLGRTLQNHARTIDLLKGV